MTHLVNRQGASRVTEVATFVCQLTRSSRELGRWVRPVLDTGTPSTLTTSAVKSLLATE